MKKILFVCHGNICRSPMAEFIMKRIARRAGKEEEYEIASSATSSEELGNPVYPMARQALAEHGIGCPGKVAVLTIPGDYAYYDMIIGMDSENMSEMMRLFDGDPDSKLSLLLDHTPETDTKHHNRDIADPWYTRNFRVAWDDIFAGCSALFEKLESQAEPTPAE